MSEFRCLKCQQFYRETRTGDGLYCPSCVDDIERSRRWWESPNVAAAVAPDEHLRRLGVPTFPGME